MLIRLTLALAIASVAFGQTPVTPTITPAFVSQLPPYTLGTGGTWTRGGSSTFAADVTVGIHFGHSQWYSYTDIVTPITSNVKGAAPTASQITTGALWLPICSATQSVCLGAIVQGGFSAVAASSTVSPAIDGALALFIHIKGGLWIVPYAKASNAASSPASGALATAVFQPGIQLTYGFGSK
jgi:hypothetical protein